MKLSGEERRRRIIETLKQSENPISGSKLASMFEVSRQVIVTDIALLRAQNENLVSTPTGYVLESVTSENPTRIFKVAHSDDEIEAELSCITELGGIVKDVFIQHKVYGTIKAPLNISNKRDIQNFLDDLKSGVSTPLKNITGNFHYHTIEAKNAFVLDEIESALKTKGFLLDTINNATVYKAKNYLLV